MNARVVKIESGRGYRDKQRRITIKVEHAEGLFDTITVRETLLHDDEINLDDELQVQFYLNPREVSNVEN